MAWFEKKLTTLNRIEVSKAAILSNFEEYKKLVGNQEVWPVVKANAYGHGLEVVTEIFRVKRLPYLVADSYYEALRIWKVSSSQRVLLIGSNHPDNVDALDYSRIALMVQDMETIGQLGRLGKKVTVHIKVDTGMGRQGVSVKQLSIMCEELKKYKHIEVEGLMSHLADADNSDDSYTKMQIVKFEQAKQLVWEMGLTPKYWHLAATYGVAKMPAGLTNAVRVGIGMYCGTYGAMRIVSTLTKIGTIDKGERVSYNGTFVAPKKMKIGVVPVGYFEGLDRRLSNKGFVKINGNYAPILGRVCMNLVVVGLDKIKAQLWDEVEVVSSKKHDKNSLESMAALCETIPYEIMVGWNGSIRRVMVD